VARALSLVGLASPVAARKRSLLDLGREVLAATVTANHLSAVLHGDLVSSDRIALRALGRAGFVCHRITFLRVGDSLTYRALGASSIAPTFSGGERHAPNNACPSLLQGVENSAGIFPPRRGLPGVRSSSEDWQAASQHQSIGISPTAKARYRQDRASKRSQLRPRVPRSHERQHRLVRAAVRMHSNNTQTVPSPGGACSAYHGPSWSFTANHPRTPDSDGAGAGPIADCRAADVAGEKARTGLQ